MLSIITVNLNNVEGLSRTIESVISQKFTNYEFIIIDGGSTDGSRELIEKLSDRVNYWVSEPDTGIYNAMNKGLNVASGKYLYFLNSGDWLAFPTVLEDIFVNDVFNDDIIYCDSWRKDKHGIWKVQAQPDLLTILRFFGHGICHQTIFYKKILFDTLGKYDESLTIVADWEFNLRALIAGCTTRHLSIPVVYYEGQGISVINTETASKEKEAILRRHLPFPVYQDYLKLKYLEKEYARLKEIEVWTDNIRNSSLLSKLAIVIKWLGKKLAGPLARSIGK